MQNEIENLQFIIESSNFGPDIILIAAALGFLITFALIGIVFFRN